MHIGLLQQVPDSKNQCQPESQPTAEHEGFTAEVQHRLRIALVGTSSYFLSFEEDKPSLLLQEMSILALGKMHF